MLFLATLVNGENFIICCYLLTLQFLTDYVVLYFINSEMMTNKKTTLLEGRLQIKYKFASKVDQICIDFDKIKSFVEHFLFLMLEQNRIFYVLILRTSSSHFNGPHPYTPGSSSLREEVCGV